MRVTLKPVSPFDFDLSANIFSEGDRQICKYEGGKYWQVIRANNKLILVIIQALGTVDEPEVLVELKSNEEISNNERKKVKEIILSLFNLNLDLNSFYEAVKNDKVMAKLVQNLRGLKSPTTSTVFEALIESVIEQQISLNVAHSLERNVVKSFGDTLKIDNEVYYIFPLPQKLASATIGQLRNCGLSSKKAEYIIDISKSIVNGKLNLDKFKDYEDSKKVIHELDKIRGIGVWTAELTMVRGMQKLEVIPADDLGVKRCISHYYCNDRKISSEEARRIAEGWGKWKGLASFYVIMAERLKVKI